MAKQRILVVDDEEDIVALVEYNLTKEGYIIKGVTSGEEALVEVERFKPDLMVLDLMLPGLDGLEVCRILKRDDATASLPILMLSAKGEDADIVTGLELGADDYVTKPFSPRVLTARVRTALRRRSQDGKASPVSGVITFKGIQIDLERHEVMVEGQPVDLTATEFSLLATMAAHPGVVYTRKQIISAVKGDDYPVTERSVDVQMVGLRKKLGDAGGCISTVRGVGYRMTE